MLGLQGKNGDRSAEEDDLHAAAVVSCTPGPESSKKVMIGTIDAVYRTSPACIERSS